MAFGRYEKQISMRWRKEGEKRSRSQGSDARATRTCTRPRQKRQGKQEQIGMQKGTAILLELVPLPPPLLLPPPPPPPPLPPRMVMVVVDQENGLVWALSTCPKHQKQTS